MSTELLLGICLGIGLAAACGFRIFIPLLVMSLSARAGLLELATGFEWIGSWTALVMFAVATLLEVGGYYIPWLDHLLDLAASPAAIIAGTIAAAASITGADPLIQWSAAIIGGAGAAGIVQSSSVAVRSASTLSTGGFGNFTVATGEWVAATAFSTLAVLVPAAAGLAVVVLIVSAIILLTRRRRFRSEDPQDSAIHS